jgi:hypothetical protein
MEVRNPSVMCVVFFQRMRVATPNDRKLSDARRHRARYHKRKRFLLCCPRYKPRLGSLKQCSRTSRHPCGCLGKAFVFGSRSASYPKCYRVHEWTNSRRRVNCVCCRLSCLWLGGYLKQCARATPNDPSSATGMSRRARPANTINVNGSSPFAAAHG